MKSKNLFLSVLIGVFFLGVYSVSAQMLKSKVRTTRERRAATILQKANEMAIKFDLNLEQKLKIIKVLTKTREEIDKLLDEVADKLNEIKGNEKSGIEAALTEEQRQKFSEPPVFEEEDELMKIYKSKY
jgi:hypothetical protein